MAVVVEASWGVRMRVRPPVRAGTPQPILTPSWKSLRPHSLRVAKSVSAVPHQPWPLVFVGDGGSQCSLSSIGGRFRPRCTTKGQGCSPWQPNEPFDD